MTAVTSKMSRMVLLYTLILSMVSLPTSLARHLLVETSGNQRGDDYQDGGWVTGQYIPKPESGPPPNPLDYDISPEGEGPKKNYKKKLMKKTQGSKNSDKTEEVAEEGEDYLESYFLFFAPQSWLGIPYY